MLGPLRVEVKASQLGRPLPSASGDDAALPLSGRRLPIILGLLLTEVGQTVSTDRIVDAVWSDGPPPATAREQVQNCTSAVRRVLLSAVCEGHATTDCGVAIVTHGHGFRLEADPHTVDAFRFDETVRESAQAPADRDEVVVRALRIGLDLWRGPAFVGLSSLELQAEAERLEELRILAIEELAHRELRLGKLPAFHAARLLSLTRRYPLRERLWLLHMEALQRAGRVTEALARFREYRTMLVADHGIEPGPEIRAKEREILQSTWGEIPAAT
jgi:DNA-binding SARP family transcriptional activator